MQGRTGYATFGPHDHRNGIAGLRCFQVLRLGIAANRVEADRRSNIGGLAYQAPREILAEATAIDSRAYDTPCEAIYTGIQREPADA